MFCTNCGAEIDSNANFCVKCGQKTMDTVSTTVIDKEQQPSNDFESSKNTLFEEDVHTFVDNNATFYATKWQQINETGKAHSWNLASFFVTTAWLGYRKMYRHVLVIALLFLAIDVLIYLSPYQYSLDSFYDPISFGTGIALMVVLGMYGNYYYRKNAVNQVTKIRESGLPPDVKQMELKRKGGTSVLGIFLAAGIMAVVYVVPSTILLPVNVDPVDEVKYGAFDDRPDDTLDDVFSDFFDRGSWKEVSSDSVSSVVAFEGVKRVDNEEHNVQIQFLNEHDNEELRIEKIVVDDEELTLLEIEDFLNYMLDGKGKIGPQEDYSDDYMW